MRAIKDIRKKIVTDEESHPVAVQIDYEDWLDIERLLGTHEPETSDPGDDFEELLKKTEGIWTAGDGLEYQIRIREEWDHRP